MYLVLENSGGAAIASDFGSRSSKAMPVETVGSAVVSLTEYLDPLVPGVMLFVCYALYGERPPSISGAVGLLTFIMWSRVARERRHRVGRVPEPGIYPYILLNWAWVVSALLFVAFAFDLTLAFSRTITLTWFLATPIALFATHALRTRASRSHVPRYIIIGANTVGLELLRRLPRSGFMGFFDFRNRDRISAFVDQNMLTGHVRDVADYVMDKNIAAVYVALPLSNVPRIGEMIRELRDTPASIYFLPDVFAFDLLQGRLVEINGMPALAVVDTPFHGRDAVLKRVADLVIASVALLFALPLMVSIAAAVKLTSRGPVLFRQRRYGLDGEEIIIYKFRTMTVCDDDSSQPQPGLADTRITSVGEMLRKTSLDELPQLINVLQGRMSLVGPRPHAAAHNEQYRKLIAGYMIRHKVRPGITGLAQVKGVRGETDTMEKMQDRIKYDLEYLSDWSPWLDLKIIVKSIWILLRGGAVHT